jgi:hypothetical protein
MAITSNTANTTVTDRTASGNQPDNTPATGTTTSGTGGSGVSSVSSGSSNVTVTSTGGGGTGAVTISVSGGSGTGNVTGTGTTTVGHVAVFNNTSATGIQDGGPASMTIAGNAVSLGGSVSQDSITGLAPTTAGIVKHTSTANTLGIAVAADFPTLNQNTTGNAATVTGLSVTSGKTLSANNTLTLSGTDGSTLNISTGGTLGSAAYTASSAYVAASSGTATNLTLAGTLKDSNSSSAGTSGQVLSSLGTGTKWVTPSSGGNVTGTSPTVSGNVAVFNNTTGTGIQDGGTLGTAAFTASTAYVSATTTQTAHKFLAGPLSGTAAPTFRVIDPTDVPTLNQSTTGNAATATTATTATTAGNVTGIVAIANGGTGTSGPSLINGTGISVTGSWPNQTITNTTSGLPSSASPGQVLLQGASTAGWYNHAYNVTAFASLSAAITAAGSNGVLYFPTAYTIPSGTTISLPVIVEGLLTCSGTATFNGTIQAPLKQIFSGGTVTIGYNNSYIYPEWFGARTGGNDYTAMVAAINSITPDTTGSTSLRTSAPIQSIVLSATYQIGSTITITNGAIFKVIGGATFIPYGSFTGDCIVYQYYTWNLSTDIPTIIGFTGGTGLTLFGCNVLKATGYMIKLCQTAIKFRASSGHNLLDNYVNIHFIPDNQIGVLFTDDGTACTIQGNEVYSNFYTNDNLSTPWAVATSDPNFSTTGYQANNICGVLWDNNDNSNWDGNIVKIEAIDINSASNSYCFHNSSSTYLSNWRIECPSWLGGLNYPYWTTQSFITGNFTACTFRFRISAELIDNTDSHGVFHHGIIWGTMNIKGFENRIVYINGGGHYNTDSAAGQPTSAYGISTTSGRSSFSTNPPLKNRLTCKYNITSSIPANGLLTLYAYVPITDAFTSGTTVSASNNFYAVPYPNSTGGTPIGLVFESAFDNSASVDNEVILFFRNVSGGTINSGTGFFDFIFTCGL